MPTPLEHPLFGTLVLDQWGEDLVTFREFPHLRIFWLPDAEGSLARLTSRQREWVENWSRHTSELAEVCRDIGVYTSLRTLGVFEVSVSVSEEGEPRPSTAQEAAFRFFLDNERAVCDAAIDSLHRYYRFARERLPDWFRDRTYPDDPTTQQLGRELVDFDGIEVARCSSGGFSPLVFHWDPIWDPEHGLAVVLHRDHMLMVGADAIDDFLEAPEESIDNTTDCEELWGREQMTEQEKIALQEFIDGFTPANDLD